MGTGAFRSQVLGVVTLNENFCTEVRCGTRLKARCESHVPVQQCLHDHVMWGSIIQSSTELPGSHDNPLFSPQVHTNLVSFQGQSLAGFSSVVLNSEPRRNSRPIVLPLALSLARVMNSDDPSTSSKAGQSARIFFCPDW